MARAKADARATVCRSNLRQIGVAVASYLGDHGVYPLTYLPELGSWQVVLRAGASSNVFHCPETFVADPRRLEELSVPGVSGPTLTIHYGYNIRGTDPVFGKSSGLGLGGESSFNGSGFDYLPCPEGRVVAPSEMIAIGDGDMSFVFGAAPVPYGDRIHVITPLVAAILGASPVGRWHHGGAHMLLCDGHVDYRRTELWISPDEQSRRAWNADNSSHQVAP